MVLLVALAGLGASEARSDDVRFAFDPETTEISFELGAFMHTVHGSARLQEGAVVADLERRELSGEVVVDATSAETGNAKRDRKMHRKVLLSEEHPQIVLRPRSWEGEIDLDEESAVTARGTLVLLGEEHEVTLPVTVRPENGKAEVAFTFDLPYVEWGLEDPSTFVLRVEKTVTVEVRATARLEPASPSGGS